LHVQLARGAPQHPRERVDGRGIRGRQLRRRRAAQLEERLAQSRQAPQILDEVLQLAAGGRVGKLTAETVDVDLRAPVVLGEDEMREVLPGAEVVRGATERARARQVRGARA